jgi:MoxR-like ATPase
MTESILLPTELDLTSECASFPDQLENEIVRTEFLDSIDDVLRGDANVLILDGPDGIGKTTICSQFARRHKSVALSLFIQPSNRMCADPTYLHHDLCCQVHLAITKQVFQGDSFPENYLLTKLPILQRLSRKMRQPLLFVVDGISELIDADLPTRQFVLQELLQIGAPGFRFVLTGDPAALLPFMKTVPNYRSQIITRLPWRDVEAYLSDAALPPALLKEIETVCKGNPGRLAQVRRILRSGITADSLADRLQEAIPDLFRVEWEPVRSLPQSSKLLLAIIAHDPFPRTIEQLASIVKEPLGDVTATVSQLSFLKIDPQTGAIAYATESLRRFAADQLRAREPQAISAVIDQLLEDQASEAALVALPTYLERVERFEQLITVLDPEHIRRFAAQSGSLRVISDRARLGLTTARRLHRHGDMARFSMHCSVISEVLRADAWQAEVDAMVALDDYAAALALAEKAVLKEDVLHLLSTIAHAQVRKGREPDPVIVDQVRRLASQIEPAGLGPRAFEIASEIVSFAPDLAISFVERSAATGKDSSNALDAMYVALTFSALSRPDARGDGAKVFEEVKAKIKGPEFRLLSTAATVWALDYGVKEVIAEVEKLEKAEDRLFLLRHWARINASKPHALKVADYGVRLAIQTTAFATNAGLFSDLATPLRFAATVAEAESIVKVISPQLATLESTGPMSAYVNLQMSLVIAESTYDAEAMGHRVLEVYGAVREHANLHVRSECTAALLDTLETVDPMHGLEPTLGMHSTVAADLEADLQDLLASTADHYEAAKQVVRALATNCFELALNIVSRLNTEDRRDRVLDDLVDRILELPTSEIDITRLERVLDCFSDEDMRDDSILSIVERLSREDERKEELAKSVCRLISRIRQISGARVKARAAALTYQILIKTGHTDEATRSALKTMQIDAWHKIDVGWTRINVGFTLASALAPVAPEMSRQYVAEISTLRSEPTIDAYSPASAFYMSLRLAIRAWSGIARSEDIARERLRRIGYLIDRLPSAGERAKLYAAAAVRAGLTGRPLLCREIVTTNVAPLLGSIEDKRYLWSVVSYCAPALYASHRGSALQRLKVLPPKYRDEAYYKIALMILGRCDPTDPYKYSPGQGYEVGYEVLLDALELCHLIDSDAECYFVIERIADSVASSKSLSREQKADIPAKLNEVIAAKFPNKRFIMHDGFKLVALAQKARLEPFVRAVWEDLIVSVMAIPNTADRAYVLATIGPLLPNRERAWRTEIFQQAWTLVSALPASRDKIERYQQLAERALEHDPKFSRECLEAGIRVVANHQSSDDGRAARLIDVAYQIDPEFASSLAAILNDDPAKANPRESRTPVAQSVGERLSTLKLSHRLGAQDVDPREMKTDQNVPEAAWIKLGELNAGKATVRPYEMEDYTEMAGEFPLSEAYPIMCWIIQNSVLRFRGTDQEASKLIPIVDATLLSAGLAQQLAARTVEQYRAARDESRIQESRELIVVKPGERERGIEFIREWLRSHVHDYLKICDPYFSLPDLEVLKLVKELRPDCSIQVLTSRREQEKAGVRLPYQEAYEQYLRLHVLSDEPPPTEVIIAGVGSPGDSPIHDRWWLTAGSGLRIGTSFNSLGISKESEVSVVAESEAAALEASVDEYLVRRRREFKSEKVSYSIVVL